MSLLCTEFYFNQDNKKVETGAKKKTFQPAKKNGLGENRRFDWSEGAGEGSGGQCVDLWVGQCWQ
jgi:hypothetical protein